MPTFIQPKLPLNFSEDGGYNSWTSEQIEEVVKQNFKSMLLTRPGERMFSPLFGVGMSNFLFEIPTNELFVEIRSTINEQASQYLPYITITDIQINFNDDNNNLQLRVDFIIDELQAKSFFELLLSR